MQKKTKYILIAAGILIGLTVGLLMAGGIVRAKIEKQLTNTQLGNFRFSCDKVRVNLLRKSLTLNGVSLKTQERTISPDSLLKTPVQFLDARIDRIALRGISLKKLKNKELDFHTLVIDSPDATIATYLMPKDSTNTNQSEKKENGWKRLSFSDMKIINGSVDWRQIKENDTLRYKILGLNVELEKLWIDSTQQSRGRLLYSDRSTVSLQTLRYTFNNRAYILAVDSLRWNSTDKSLSLSNTELIPQYSKRDFPRKSARKSDYMQFDLKNLALTGFNADKLWSEGIAEIDSVHLASGNFISYKDRNAVVPARIKPMMHAVIQRLGIPVDIRKIKIDDMNAVYEELALNRTIAGRVSFDRIDATFYGFTNIVKRKDQYVELYATAKLMNQGKLDAVVSMPVDSTNNHFEVKATLTSSAPALNRMIQPLTGLEIKSGTIDRMDFHMSGTNRSASVNMILRYKEVKVELVKLKRGEWKARDGLSNIANWALIKNDNPDKHGLRSAQTTVHRDPHRSAYNYLWKGISAGALETIGTGAAKRLRDR